jgi:hypothetical protein
VNRAIVEPSVLRRKALNNVRMLYQWSYKKPVNGKHVQNVRLHAAAFIPHTVSDAERERERLWPPIPTVFEAISRQCEGVFCGSFCVINKMSMIMKAYLFEWRSKVSIMHEVSSLQLLMSAMNPRLNSTSVFATQICDGPPVAISRSSKQSLFCRILKKRSISSLVA